MTKAPDKNRAMQWYVLQCNRAPHEAQNAPALRNTTVCMPRSDFDLTSPPRCAGHPRLCVPAWRPGGNPGSPRQCWVEVCNMRFFATAHIGLRTISQTTGWFIAALGLHVGPSPKALSKCETLHPKHIFRHRVVKLSKTSALSQIPWALLSPAGIRVGPRGPEDRPLRGPTASVSASSQRKKTNHQSKLPQGQFLSFCSEFILVNLGARDEQILITRMYVGIRVSPSAVIMSKTIR